MKRTRLFAPVALALALSPLLASCTGAGLGAQNVTADQVVQNVRDAMKNVTSVQGTVDLALTINKDGIRTLLAGIMPTSQSSQSNSKDPLAKLPDSVNVTLKYWRETPDKARVEVDSASIPGAKGAILVYDGQKVYALDAANNTVYTATPSKFADKVPDEIKTMMAGIDMESEIDKVISASDIKLSGSEKVSDVDTYKLDVTPKPDAATLLGIPQTYAMEAGVLIKDLHATLWVDQNNWIPVKMTLEHPNIGSFTYTASGVELNKTFDQGTFVLQVPAGAKTVDLDEKADQAQPKQTTLPDARDYAKGQGWTLLEPSYVPDGATLVGVTQMQKAMGGGVQLSYSSKDLDFTIMEAHLGRAAGMMGSNQDMMSQMMGLGDGFSGVNAPDALKDVTIRGVPGKAFSPDGGGWTSLMWQEKDSGVYVVLHGKLTLDEATKIAEGLK